MTPLPESRTHGSAWVLRDAQAVHLNLEMLIDTHSVDAVGLRGRPGFGKRFHDRAVDDEINLIRHHAYFERIGAGSLGIRLLHGGVGRSIRHFLRSSTGSALDKPRPVVGD